MEEELRLYCKFCGKGIPRNKFQSEITYSKRKTCGSYECKKALLKSYCKEYKEEYRKCKNCGNNFLWTSSMPQQIYCSKKCGKEAAFKYFLEHESGFLKLRFEVLKRDNFTCQYCGRNPRTNKNVELQVDHILPRSKDGKFEINNLITSCFECNQGKGDIILKKKDSLTKNKRF